MSLLNLLFAKPSSPAPPPAPPPEPNTQAQPGPAAPTSTPAPIATTEPAGSGQRSPAPAAPAGMFAGGRGAASAGTPVTAAAVRAEFTRPDEDAERSRAMEMQRRWTLAEVIGAIGKAPGPDAILARADRPGPVEPGSLIEAVKAMRASIPGA